MRELADSESSIGRQITRHTLGLPGMHSDYPTCSRFTRYALGLPAMHSAVNSKLKSFSRVKE